jgi:hypothetical protein
MTEPTTKACACASCRATRAHVYSATCCPDKLSHGVNCICGVTIRATSAPAAQTETGEATTRRAADFAGFREVAPGVHVSASEVVVLGTPPGVEDENDPAYHNCDAMSCGQEHVVYRASLTARSQEQEYAEAKLAILVEAVRAVGGGHWDAPRWNLQIRMGCANAARHSAHTAATILLTPDSAACGLFGNFRRAVAVAPTPDETEKS